MAGLHYPRSTGEFLAWFATDEDCLDYLEWLRWPDGFVCPYCGEPGGWRLGDGRFGAPPAARTSVTAGTIFDRTRTPLTVWFTACWLFATQKDGISALSLQRSLEIGSYQTAWAMLHRLRSVLVRPGRERLTGRVEVDETFIGGEEPGLRGGRAKGKKILVGIAVEVASRRGSGGAGWRSWRTRRPRRCVRSSVTMSSRAATVITDGWQRLYGLDQLGYPHERRSQGPPAAAARTPGCCPACTGSPRCPSGGCWAPTRARSTAHLQGYLDEFVFRFNRRTSRSRGLVFYRVLELAAGHEPVRYRRHHCREPARKPRSQAAAARGTRAPAQPGPPAAGPARGEPL